MKRILVTSALPYINGIKHLGNLVGSMLPADVYTRYMRQQGHEVLYICGTDDHGTPAEIAAEKAGQPVQAFCQQMYETQKDIYARFQIGFDYFGQSSAEENHALTQTIFKALDAAGFIEARDIEQIYSLDDERYLPDRYVEGTCPKCHEPKARGDQCDACGSLLNPTDIIEPYSAISGSKRLEVRHTKHLFLQLDQLQDRVGEWVESHTSWPAVTKGIAKKWLQEGLQSRCISRDLSWGVPIPKEGFEGKVFYVWFDAPNAYIAMTQAWAKAQGNPDAWQDWWQQEEVDYIQFMAKDNVPFHAIFWPAMLMGADLNFHLADEIKSMSWLNYDGGKFSTSQQRGVFTDKALELFPADWWRYYLMANIPEGADTDFTFADFAQTINKDCADVLGNFVNRVSALVKKYFDTKVPPADISHAGFADFQPQYDQLLKDYAQAMETQSFRKALQALRAVWVLGNEYITKMEPWKLAKTNLEAAGAVLNVCLHLIHSIAILTYPVMPSTATQLLSLFAEPATLESASIRAAADLSKLTVGAAITPTGRLFEKIDSDRIAELTAQYAGKDE